MAQVLHFTDKVLVLGTEKEGKPYLVQVFTYRVEQTCDLELSLSIQIPQMTHGIQGKEHFTISVDKMIYLNKQKQLVVTDLAKDLEVTKLQLNDDQLEQAKESLLLLQDIVILNQDTYSLQKEFSSLKSNYKDLIKSLMGCQRCIECQLNNRLDSCPKCYSSEGKNGEI